MPAVRGHRRDQAAPDLRGQGRQLIRPEILQILGTAERIKECHTATVLAMVKYRQPVARGNILPPFRRMTVSCHCTDPRRVRCGGRRVQARNKPLHRLSAYLAHRYGL
ncbi:hypothetical protein SBRY_10928 [Actinacidiphila bryophytorum]|uniref:Uncharacterized protein n=1 Tax=Actinacidiphila bryophytorum TaxID=1436133 RepID=A0A9W4ECQ8_9ACTN|nr:hypothetical protein SBRY_10928 [Actinacidiphila bryophytorum]